MGYSWALTAAGATVVEFKTTGSYQGTWGAIVDYNGERSLVTGYYGSCSHCDAYQAEFDRYGDSEDVHTRDGKYYDGNYEEIDRETYDIMSARMNERLAEFGRSYLANPVDKATIQNHLDYYDAKMAEDDWFNNEERELYDWAIRFF